MKDDDMIMTNPRGSVSEDNKLVIDDLYISRIEDTLDKFGYRDIGCFFAEVNVHDESTDVALEGYSDEIHIRIPDRLASAYPIKSRLRITIEVIDND